jgi:PHD/YefM family antitoxin component YafN of YafNO toxin-antitoxin module
MLRTINVSTLRNELSSLISSLEIGPILVLSQSRPKAVLMDPNMFYSLVEKVEMLEDLVDGRREITEYRTDPTSFLDAEDVFEHFDHL